MKIFLLSIIFTILLAFNLAANAWELKWDASKGRPTGYNIYYHLVDAPEDVIKEDVGNVLVLALDNIGLLEGSRYEFYATAYNEAGESPSSEHIRFTYPKDSIIIEMLGAPVQITINP